MSSESLSRKDYKYFDVAKTISRTSNFHGTHVGCCVVYKGVVTSVGCNSEKSHPLQMKYNRFRDFDPNASLSKVHAEVHALSLMNSAGKHIDWSKASIYVYRELKNGKPAISKPCPACNQLIKDLGIANMCYIDESGHFVKENLI